MSNLFRRPVYEKGIIQDMVVVAKRTHLVALYAIRISGSLDITYQLEVKSPSRPRLLAGGPLGLLTLQHKLRILVH